MYSNKIMMILQAAKQYGEVDLEDGYVLTAEEFPTEDGTNGFYWEFSIEDFNGEIIEICIENVGSRKWNDFLRELTYYM